VSVYINKMSVYLQPFLILSTDKQKMMSRIFEKQLGVESWTSDRKSLVQLVS